MGERHNRERGRSGTKQKKKIEGSRRRNKPPRVQNWLREGQRESWPQQRVRRGHRWRRGWSETRWRNEGTKGKGMRRGACSEGKEGKGKERGVVGVGRRNEETEEGKVKREEEVFRVESDGMKGRRCEREGGMRGEGREGLKGKEKGERYCGWGREGKEGRKYGGEWRNEETKGKGKMYEGG